MANNLSISWNNDNTITYYSKHKPKKITGTKFSCIFGKNPYIDAFKVWCDITRVYEEPVSDNIYTNAGKIIEPKQAIYVRDNLGFSNLKTPTDIFGENYFDKTRGNFFDTKLCFGGMWDYIDQSPDGKINAVFEMKTSKHPEQWEYDIPEHYALQASLYAYLLGVEQVHMVASFLNTNDYSNPDLYSCNESNTVIRSFKLNERYPNFEGTYILPAQNWWNKYIFSCKSPKYSLKKDKQLIEILKNKYTELI